MINDSELEWHTHKANRSIRVIATDLNLSCDASAILKGTKIEKTQNNICDLGAWETWEK